MADSYSEAAAAQRAAQAALDDVHAQKRAEALRKPDADVNQDAVTKAAHESWTGTRFLGHARRRGR